MARYNTNNPVPSTAMKDLSDNAQIIDEFANSIALTVLDRLGVEKYTLAGLTNLVKQIIGTLGWVPFGTFEAGATLTDATQTLKYEADGNYYRWDGDFDKAVPAGSTPDSTGGVAQGAWVNVTDLTLRSALDNHSGFPAIEDYLDRNALRLRYATLADLVSGNSYGGLVDFSNLVGKIVTTDFHNNAVSNTSLGGGARYVIQSAVGYGAVPDGAIVNSVLAGADHYVGGGTEYIAKYLPNADASIDSEALGLYQGQPSAASTTVFEMAFKYAYLRNPVAPGRARYIKLPTKIFTYNNQFEGAALGVHEINLSGSGMPQVNNTTTAVSGGTHIKGRMMLNIRSGHFHDFGVDQSGLATDNDCFKCFSDLQSNAGAMRVERVLAFGRDYNEATHGIILAGYHKAEVYQCQGYYTWYGLSIDANIGIVDGFIGGYVKRNVVNAKSHPNASQASLNKSMVISNVVGFGTVESGANVGAAIVAIESDAGQVERVVINNIVGTTAYALVAVAPYNGAIINNLVISNLTGSDFDGPAIWLYSGSGGGAIYDVSIDHISLANLKNQALFAKDVRFLSVDRLFASAAASNPTTNTNFVEITPTVTCPELSRITLTGQYNTGGFAGAVAWNNTEPTKARRSMMRCVELGSGKPTSLG